MALYLDVVIEMSEKLLTNSLTFEITSAENRTLAAENTRLVEHRDLALKEVTRLTKLVSDLKSNSIALADHARFMSEAHDGGRCKAALRNHAALMEKIEKAGI
jgi:hypothetical protein